MQNVWRHIFCSHGAIQRWGETVAHKWPQVVEIVPSSGILQKFCEDDNLPFVLLYVNSVPPTQTDNSNYTAMFGNCNSGYTAKQET